jgi:very-short-patch-repair endonuclease
MRWHEVAAAQDGVISRDQLRTAGVGNVPLSRLLARGALTRRQSGIYLVGGAPMTYRARLWASVLATQGILAFHTAAELWGLADRPDETIHVLVPHARRLVVPPGVRIHRRRRGADAYVHLDALPVTSRSDTVIDQLGVLTAREASMLADRAVQRRWLKPEQVATRLAEHPRRPGNRQLRRISARLGDGAAAMSERRLHRILRANGIRGWKANYQVWRDGSLVAVLDVAIPHLMLALEVDGMAYHVDVDRFQRDRTRQNTLVNLGWTVLRFTWADLVDRPGYVAASIRRRAA